MSTSNPMERLINLMSGMVSAGADDAMRLASALRDGSVDLNEVQHWYEQRRDQSIGMMREIGDELDDLRRQGVGRYVNVGKRQLERGSDALRRAAARSRRRSARRRSASSRWSGTTRRARHVARRSARRTVHRRVRRAHRQTARRSHAGARS